MRFHIGNRLYIELKRHYSRGNMFESKETPAVFEKNLLYALKKNVRYRKGKVIL